MKKLVPNYYAKNIYSINLDFFKENNIEFILCDLDNTLDAFNAYIPSDRAKELVKQFKLSNINFFIVSNNRNKRVGKYSNELGVDYLCRSGKPFGHKIKKFINSKSLDISKGVLIGDQLLTDVIAAKRTGIRVLLVEQLVKIDQWCTFINRRIDNILRRKMIKRGQIKLIGGVKDE